MGKLKFEENDLGWFIREDGVETETTKFETIGIISKHIENPDLILDDDIAILKMSAMEEIVEFMKKNIQNKQKEVKNKMTHATLIDGEQVDKFRENFQVEINLRDQNEKSKQNIIKELRNIGWNFSDDIANIIERKQN